MPSPIKTPTPRTDEQVYHEACNFEVDWETFSRTLETELAEAKADITRAQAGGNALYLTIVKRLESHFPKDTRDLEWDVIPGTLETLASSLAASQERVRELEEGLSPFAKFLFGARSVWAGAKDSDVVLCGYSDAVSGETTGVNVTMGDFRKARALLKS